MKKTEMALFSQAVDQLTTINEALKRIRLATEQ